MDGVKGEQLWDCVCLSILHCIDKTENKVISVGVQICFGDAGVRVVKSGTRTTMLGIVRDLLRIYSVTGLLVYVCSFL